MVTGVADAVGGGGEQSASKSRLVCRKMDEYAAAVLPHSGSQRPFGFQPDKIIHDPVEADVVRTMVARMLAGASARSITTWLNGAGDGYVTSDCGVA